jgi:hypothetical protein
MGHSPFRHRVASVVLHLPGAAYPISLSAARELLDDSTGGRCVITALPSVSRAR